MARSSARCPQSCSVGGPGERLRSETHQESLSSGTRDYPAGSWAGTLRGEHHMSRSFMARLVALFGCAGCAASPSHSTGSPPPAVSPGCAEQGLRQGARSTSVGQLRGGPEQPGVALVTGFITHSFGSAPCPTGAECQPAQAGVNNADNPGDEANSITLPIEPNGFQVGLRYAFLVEFLPGYKASFGFAGPAGRPMFLRCSEPAPR